MNLNESKLWKEIHQQDECVRECLKIQFTYFKRNCFQHKAKKH